MAAGTLTTWLLAGEFAKLLEQTLPQHTIHAPTLLALSEEILLAPATYAALGVISLGLALGWRVRKQATVSPPALVETLSRESFGLDWLNKQIAAGTLRFAALLQKTQTGQLNWNVLGILGALVLVLGILLWSA